MKTPLSRMIYSVLLVVNLYSYEDTILGDDMKGEWTVSKPKALFNLPPVWYPKFSSAEVFMDSSNRIIVFCSFGYKERENDIHKEKALMFVSEGDQWVSSILTTSGYWAWQGMINNGVFQACSVRFPQATEAGKTQTICIYDIGPDMKLILQPTIKIDMDGGKKVFKHEDYRDIMHLLPLDKIPYKFFVVGYYVENRWNLSDLIKRVKSFGHWGFVKRPFAAIIDNNNVSGYYTTSENLKTNERSRISSWAVCRGKIHFIGVKHREYCDDPPAIQYLYFDISNNQWAEPLELFRGYRKGEKITNFFDNPSLACNGENIYFTWPWIVIDYDRRTRTNESGIYFCSKTNNQWNKADKLSDSGEQPKVIVDNNGKVYVFWIEPGKGLFCKVKTDTGWSDTYLAIKDETIRIKEIGLPGPVSPPLSITVDQNNNLHIIYIREIRQENSSMGFVSSEELVYIKLTNTQK